jgi:hypothetical protein
LKATVEDFANAYAAASPDEEAELRLWMRKIILAGRLARRDLARAKRSEKGSIVARDRRVVEFPLSMTPYAVAKALRAEGWYRPKTIAYHIEHRVSDCGKKQSESVLERARVPVRPSLSRSRLRKRR